ncbi:MAG: hypothetical protein NZ602_07575 [Thermoguttaceae bacterium]|nr:hypothetical protein [Thermoguttaceae bacterium]MDW8037170.1 hypothetical protein [Thermoguttaceae bacterium]
MGQVLIGHVEDQASFQAIRQALEMERPYLRVSRMEIHGQTELTSERGGMRVFWIYRGRGEVFLPAGYRTQEGDGQKLPAEYQPEPLLPAFAQLLRQIQSGLSTIRPEAQIPVRAILSRWKAEDTFVGDIGGELWKLEHLPRPWAEDPQTEAALAELFGHYRSVGYSTKQSSSWEPIMEGDQLVVDSQQSLWVRGQFACLSMEHTQRPLSHVSAVRRLRYLADTAGGCNPDFDPFRRLPLTWYMNAPGDADEGINWVNSHVVNIPRETSPSHFHPSRPIRGGQLQTEMYLVLDPDSYRLNTSGRTPFLIVFPELRNLRRYEQHQLAPGKLVYIPPGTGHRGLDVFVNVLTLPGFKPHNEYYIDRDIRDLTSGASPYNQTLLEAKNYQRIEDLLA